MSAIGQNDRDLLALVLSPSSLPELLERSGMPIDRFLDWFDSPPIRRILDRLQGFATFRTTLKASLAGPVAATALSTLLETADNPVERRRLASTLIRTGKPARRSRASAEPSPQAGEPPPPSSGTAAAPSVSRSSGHESERASPRRDGQARSRSQTGNVAPAAPNDLRECSAATSRLALGPASPLRSKRAPASTLMGRAGAAELPRAG
jgi:hypothetical protein